MLLESLQGRSHGAADERFKRETRPRLLFFPSDEELGRQSPRKRKCEVAQVLLARARLLPDDSIAIRVACFRKTRISPRLTVPRFAHDREFPSKFPRESH